MNDVYLQLVTYLSGIWRRRWLVIALAWLVCGAGWTTVASLPDRYESHARIYVDMDTMLGPLMKGIAVEMNLFQQIDIMRRTLMSRPNIEKIILMTDLDLTVKNDEDKERLIDELHLAVAPVLLGSGEPLLEGLNLKRLGYECVEFVPSGKATHVVIRRLERAET